jgi:Nitronate monooxygenase/Cation transporter/ATPase, N-terminus
MPNDPSLFASIRGLSQADVEARQKTEGYNELPRPDRRTRCALFSRSCVSRCWRCCSAADARDCMPGRRSGGARGNSKREVDTVKLPVIAAGGIADGRGLAAAFALGAEGVQIEGEKHARRCIN